MKKILAIALTLILVFALAAPAYADGGSVYWLNFKPELDESAQKLAAMYTEQTGVPVKVVTAASGQYACSLALTTSTVAASVVAIPNTSSTAQRITTRAEYLLPGFTSDVRRSTCILLLSSKPAGGVRRSSRSAFFNSS